MALIFITLPMHWFFPVHELNPPVTEIQDVTYGYIALSLILGEARRDLKAYLGSRLFHSLFDHPYGSATADDLQPDV